MRAGGWQECSWCWGRGPVGCVVLAWLGVLGSCVGLLRWVCWRGWVSR